MSDTDTPHLPPPDDLAPLDAYSRAVVAVVDRVSPTVANLVVTFENRGPMRQGSGSGLVFTSDGYVLTNAHVVEGAATIEVHTPDGGPLPAQLVGADPATDLAVVRVSASGLASADLSEAGTLSVGQVVIAFGSPLGFDASVSTGIISSLTRAMRARDGRLIENVIQHTAPLNPGNSGGPLVDTRGQVVGINTAIIGMAQLIGFAVPAATALWVVPELLAHGHVRRGYLGIAGRDRPLTRLLQRHFELAIERGMEVMAIEPGSPAANADLWRGDVVVAIDDIAVDGVDALHRHLTRWPTGREARLTILRGRQKLTVVVTPATA